MSFTEAIRSVFSKYVDFEGRARRSEYWYFVLFNMLVSSVLAWLTRISPLLSGLIAVYEIAVFLPSLAVAFRRLHDIGKSGWYLLIGFVPIVGAILLIVWFCREGERRGNLYGPDPKPR